MYNITTCSIKNEVDKQIMTLSVEWNDDNVTILIMRHGALPLRGQIATVTLVEAADNFNRSKEEYLEDIKQELSGENPEIQFLLKEKLFLWKKKIWTRGKITCEPLTDTVDLSNLFINIIEKNTTNQRVIFETEKENNKLKKKISKLEKSMESMTKHKGTIEDDLYEKFLVLLNMKKRNIRKLRDKLLEYSKNPVFDESTDESDIELNDVEVQPVTKRIKLDINSNGCETSVTKSNEGLSIFNKIINKIENAHESEDNNDDDDDDSFELKFEESQQCQKRKFKIIDEEPEEDMFSS